MRDADVHRFPLRGTSAYLRAEVEHDRVFLGIEGDEDYVVVDPHVFPRTLIEALDGDVLKRLVLFLLDHHISLAPYAPRDVERQAQLARRAEALDWKDEG